MKDVLLDIESSKRDKIINAAIVEFSKNGYEKASTNAIVKRAGVSKGLIYHYFENKQALYDYLVYYVFNLVITDINEKLDFNESDIFERFKNIAIIKMDINRRHPSLYDVIPKFYEDKTFDDIVKLTENFSPDLFQRIFSENIDFSLFKESVDVEKALKIIQWTTEKVGEEFGITQIGKEDWDLNEYAKLFDDYMQMLKNAFYK